LEPEDLTSALFTVVTAAEEGRLGFAVDGTDEDPDGWDHNAGNAPDTVNGNLYAGVLMDADTADPTVLYRQLTTDSPRPARRPVQAGRLLTVHHRGRDRAARG
jgi:hypothetical protein